MNDTPTPATALLVEAMSRFQSLWARAGDLGLNEPTVATLATADAAGRPSARALLVKQIDARGFVFYTNTESRKADHLRANPWGALCFFWDPLMEQVRVEGAVAPVPDAEADAYWRTRARDSQLGGWASEQSRALDSRETLERRVAEIDARYRDAEVPRPPFWSGYRLTPESIEFWKTAPHRLNDRLRYGLEDGAWQVSRLYP